jgi:hypothetical protein
MKKILLKVSIRLAVLVMNYESARAQIIQAESGSPSGETKAAIILLPPENERNEVG